MSCFVLLAQTVFLLSVIFPFLHKIRGPHHLGPSPRSSNEIHIEGGGGAQRVRHDIEQSKLPIPLCLLAVIITWVC